MHGPTHCAERSGYVTSNVSTTSGWLVMFLFRTLVNKGGMEANHPPGGGTLDN